MKKFFKGVAVALAAVMSLGVVMAGDKDSVEPASTADATAYIDISGPGWAPIDGEWTNVKVDKDGTYTVGVKAAATVEGLAEYSSLQITNGETLYGNKYTVTIDKIVINGDEVALQGDSYTCSQDGKKATTRVNLYNEYNDPDFEPDKDGYVDCRTTGDQAKATARLVDGWKEINLDSIEVTFTVKGIDKEEESVASETASSTTSTASTAKDKGGAKTGDSTAVAILAIVALASLTGAVVVKKHNA